MKRYEPDFRMTDEEYKRKALDPIVNYIESVMASYSKEELEDRIKKALPEKESEDEKIRKLLVWQVRRNIEDETYDLARSVYDGIKGHDPDLEESIEDWKKCLAYLERQKEPEIKVIIPKFRVGDIVKSISQPSLPPEEIKSIGKDCYWTERGCIGFAWEKDYEHVEQKPAEWSEEDEKMLVGIIERGSAQIPPHEPALREEQMEWLMNRLKTLRPQPRWKPSKEQMKDLELSSRMNGVTCPNLKSLYNDLKKLM